MDKRLSDPSGPKCPGCKVRGVSHIVSVDSEETDGDGNPYFFIVHCADCGHVYGVFTKEFGPEPIDPGFS